MNQTHLDAAALQRALALADLTDPAHGPHAMQLVVSRLVDALATRWQCAVVWHRGHPVVSLADNYTRLRYPGDGAARDARYTRYVDADHVLRTQTSAMVPPLLRCLAEQRCQDVLLVCPGLVYRRDSVDRLHTGEPHQLDLWRISTEPLNTTHLHQMVHTVVGALWPDPLIHMTPAVHPYTVHGVQMDVVHNGQHVEVGECGMAHPQLLAQEGLGSHVTGLAMGLGLDRLLMLLKGVPDIRLLRAADPRIACQMQDVLPYVPVSMQPATVRDLSVAVAEDTVVEELGDRVRQALEDQARCVESVEILSQTPWRDLPAVARERLGMSPDQNNVLVRVVLRDLERTLTAPQGNALRDRIYRALHQGTRHQWAGSANR